MENEITLKEKMTYEKISQDLKNMGFTQNGDTFQRIFYRTQNMIINGQPHVQRQECSFTIRYTGDGGILDENNEIPEPMFFFDILDGNTVVEGFSIYEANDLYKMFNIFK